MIRRAGYGALWSLPVAIAFFESIGGGSGLLLFYAAVYALLGFDVAVLRRRSLRLLLWLAAIVLATGLWPHGTILPALDHLQASLRQMSPKALGTADATLLFALLLPALVGLFELEGGLAWRLMQCVLGISLVGYVGSLEVNVALSAIALPAGFMLVRYHDLAREPAHGRRSLQIYAVLGIGVALLLGQSLIAYRPAPGSGPGAQQGYPLDIAHLDVTLTPETNAAFFAQSRQPLYWQVFTAYDYTGQGWRHTGSWRAVAPGQEGLRPKRGTRLVVERVEIKGNLPTDPVAGSVVEVLSPLAPWRYNAGSGAYVVPGRDIEIVAALPRLGLKDAERVAVGAQGAPKAALRLPRDLPAALRSLARRIVRGVRPTVGAEAAAIIAYLHSHERYSLQVPPDDGHDYVWDFLFVHHAGDCNSFSSAFVVLARLDGIPARWVAGYLPGSPEAGGRLVTAADAHSWAEVWVPRQGWLPLDPTPGFSLPRLQSRTKAQPNASATGQLPQVRIGRQGRLEALNALARAAQALGPVGGGRARQGPSIWWLVPAALVAVLWAALWALGAKRRLIFGLRTAAYVLRRPWRRQETVRQWLKGDAPALCRYVEWRLYEPGGSCPVSGRAALRSFLDCACRWLQHGRRAV